MLNPTVFDIENVLTAKGYNLFKNDSKNHNLNLVGIRTANNQPNSFDDWMCVLWNYSGVWNKLQFRITTDPGLYWLEHPMNTMGTAIVKEGRYPGVWQLGKHQGKYRALTQKANITVIRDFDRDENLDFTTGREETDLFGINCHRANAARRSIQVGKWSAGCQVFADPADFNTFLGLCESAAKNWGNSFTYTLLHEADFQLIS